MLVAHYIILYRGNIFILRTVTCKVDEREDSLAGQVVIVTGASSGIGFQIALEMARRLVLSFWRLCRI